MKKSLTWSCSPATSSTVQESAKIQPIERPFTPDTGKDFGSIWKRQAEQITPTTRKLAKPNAMMFFHIPLWVRTTPHSF